MYIFLLPLLVVALIMLPVFAIIFRKDVSGKKIRTAFRINLCTFVGVLIMAFIVPVSGMVSAAQTADETAETGTEVTQTAAAASSDGMGFLAAALATGLGSIGCGIAVAAAAPAAIGAVSEEPKAFSKALIFVALGEGVALYGFLISFMILGKIG